MLAIVTGSSGFIGPHLCEALRCRGDDVIEIDLKNGTDVLTCELPDANVVFHLAAQTDAYCDDAEADAKANILGSIRIFERYRSKCVFTSSSMVNYPTTPYAISKRACEDYAKLYGVTIARLCNIYGPGGHSVIDRFGSDDTLTIYGDGEQRRSYAHVSRAVQFLLIRAGLPGLHILKPDIEASVNEIAKQYDMPITYAPARAGDMADARQIV